MSHQSSWQMSRRATWTPRSGQEIIQILRRLNETSGITVIIVTHEEEVARHAGRVITMRDGEIVGDEHSEARAKAQVSRESREPAE